MIEISLFLDETIKTTKRLGLRELKSAKKRLKLTQALVRRLALTPLEEVVMRDLCDDVEVSEITFFNYFPRKHIRDEISAFVERIEEYP